MSCLKFTRGYWATTLVRRFLGNASYPDAELARLIAFDDCDVGVANVALDSYSKVLHRDPCRQSAGEQHAAHFGGRPQQHLRGAVLADDLGLDRRATDAEPLGQMNSEPQAVEQRSGAEQAVGTGDGRLVAVLLSRLATWRGVESGARGQAERGGRHVARCDLPGRVADLGPLARGHPHPRGSSNSRLCLKSL